MHVQFYVDKLFLSADTDGPPYDALWSDEKPFEARELMVEAELPSGTMIRDYPWCSSRWRWKEATSVSSVSVDAVVFDDKGRFVKDLSDKEFNLFENGEAQTLDYLRQDRDPALFALLVDSSQSMAIRSDAVSGSCVAIDRTAGSGR
jgi:hypothetical protein